ncbi:MAG TPA: ATP-binding protein [Candidatus Limnocylindrales bacterium]|jgi:signal transduction histidine kinase|nr:ATP-binding protein [Candidatus Limnocylindrales bacterium]
MRTVNLLLRAPIGAAPTSRRRFDARRLRPAVVLAAIFAAEVMLLLESAPQIDTPLYVLSAAVIAGLVVHLAIAKRTLERELDVQRAQAIEAVDSERQRIQRDLHDSAQQRLLSVRIRMGLLAGQRRRDRSSLVALARDLDTALAEIRSVTLDGRPELLRRLGVPAALRSAAASASVPVVIDAPGFGRLAPLLEQNLYFCCLEAVQNVVKHAGAQRAWIRLRREADRVAFEVEDVGRGFDPSRVDPGEGLRNIEDRVVLLGGRLSIDTTPQQGTRIRGEIPVR